MFWSPAVTTLSVVCAAAGKTASASAAATRESRRFIGISLQWTCSLQERSARRPDQRVSRTSCGVPRGKEEQRLARDDDRRRRSLRHPRGRVHPDAGVGRAYAIAPPLADVDRLRDYAVDDEAAVARHARVREVRGVAPEM